MHIYFFQNERVWSESCDETKPTNSTRMSYFKPEPASANKRRYQSSQTEDLPSLGSSDRPAHDGHVRGKCFTPKQSGSFIP